MDLSNIKISVKLGVVFLILVVLSAVTGGFAVTQLARINANTEEMARKWLPSNQHIAEIQGQLNALRRAAPSFSM